MGAIVDMFTERFRRYLDSLGIGLAILLILAALAIGYWLGGPWLLAVILAAMALLAWG